MRNLDQDPEEHPECRYCSCILSTAATEKHSEFNELIFESDNFIVVPSLGHFISGWVLIIPRLHFPCLGALDERLYSEFLSVKLRSETLLRSIYGNIIQFEHGSCSVGMAGVCVDHAHLHLVPVRADFEQELSSRFVGQSIRSMESLAVAYRESRSYLFYENNNGDAKIYDVAVLPSQYMRMLVGREVGMLDHYDWRSYRGEEELNNFLQRLKEIQPWRASSERIAQRSY